MKKTVRIFSFLLSVLMIFSASFLFSSAEEYTLKTSEINVRDPFVLVYDGKYYMYGTGLAGSGYGCVVSEDLENWSQRIQVFRPETDFDGDGNFWAPECHYYNGKFYLFATYHSKTSGKRGVGIFRADLPTGPFELISDGHATPHYRDCIDGTLYVDESGQPWMVYVEEWTSNEDGVGTMAAVKLSDDLSHFVGEPKTIFRADGHIWTDSSVTDGPFLYKSSNGTLLMLWSNSAKSGGYAVGLALSADGKPDGKWVHQAAAIYKKDSMNERDGGHGMLFTDLDGQLTMAIHSPNGSGDGVFETAKFIPMTDTGYSLQASAQRDNSPKIITALTDAFRECCYKVLSFFAKL